MINVLANDKLVENPGGSLTITAVTQGANGTVEIRPGGLDLVYQPNANFAGSDTFTYTITDNKGGTDTATVTVHRAKHARCSRRQERHGHGGRSQQEQHHRRAGQRRGSRRRQADGDQGHARHRRHGRDRHRRRQRGLHAQRRLQRQRHLHLHDHRSGRLDRHRDGAGDGDRNRSRLQGQRRRRRVLRPPQCRWDQRRGVCQRHGDRHADLLGADRHRSAVDVRHAGRQRPLDRRCGQRQPDPEPGHCLCRRRQHRRRETG